MKYCKAVWCGATAILIGTTGIPASSAWAAAGTAHGVTITLDFSSNPMTSLNPPVGPPLTIPTSCPFDYATTFAITGNGVFHQSTNQNGGWGGDTINGSATLSDGSSQYIGQATAWSGGGGNAVGQGEEGGTFHFHATSTSDGSVLDVRISYHGTLNAAGNLTNFHEDFICS